MNLKTFINKFNMLFPRPRTFMDEDVQMLQRRIVKRYAQGNISLHLGEYITSMDLDLLKKKIASHNFV